MKTVISAVVLLVLATIAIGKPVYNHKTSYVTQLTDFNFKDQVTKIRQNTNYVSIVQFYKYDGKCSPMKIASPCSLLLKLTIGSTNTTVCSRLEQLTVSNTLRFARMKQWKCSLPSRFTLQHPCLQL